MHPSLVEFNEEAEVLGNVFETIVSADDRGNLIPNLCERWETLEEGARFLFVLRKDLRLSDGRKLSAKLLKSSFEDAVRISKQFLAPGFDAIRGIPQFLSQSSDEIDGLTVASENSLEIHLVNPLPIYPALLTDLRCAVACRPMDHDSGNFIGTGPYQIVSFEKDSILLERNGNYWKGTFPLLDALDFRFVRNSAEVAEGFRSGRFDLARNLLPQDLEELLRDSHGATAYVEALQKNVFYVIFNQSSPIFRVSEVRQAMAGVAGMHDLVLSTLGRLAQLAEGILPPGILGHDPGRRPNLMTLEKAKELIHSTGLPLPIHLQAAVHPLYQDR
jgi:peptide/nickel transport system substrate-binding protein